MNEWEQFEFPVVMSFHSLELGMSNYCQNTLLIYEL